MSLREFDYVELSLDNKTELGHKRDNDINFPVKYMRMTEYSDQSVKVVAHFSDGQKITLLAGSVIKFEETRKNIRFTWEAQTGKTCLIEFSQFAELQPLPLKSSMALAKPANFTQTLSNVNDTGLEVLGANADREESYVRNLTDETVWYGTDVNIGAANYQTLCESIGPGELYRHDLTCGMFFRIAAGTLNDALRVFEKIRG